MAASQERSRPYLCTAFRKKTCGCVKKVIILGSTQVRALAVTFAIPSGHKLPVFSSVHHAAKALRKKLGAISCRCDDIGPSGGFCLSVENPSKGGNHFLDDSLVKQLQKLYDGHDVLDLGCGLGTHCVAAFADAGAVASWLNRAQRSLQMRREIRP